MKKRKAKAPKHDLIRKTNRFPQFAKRATSLILCIGIILSFSSCWSRRELNTLAIVLATAFDTTTQPEMLQVTAQVVKPGQIKASSSASGGEATQKAYTNIKSIDKSVISAYAKITRMNNRTMYFSHNRIIILSRELAEKGISEEVDSFTRNNETRLNVYLLVSEGKASDILNEEFDLESIPANHIAEMIENQKINSETAITTLRDFDIAMLSDSTTPLVPIIKIYETDGKNDAKLEGTAVFKDGKMIGEFNVSQTRGLLWVTGKAHQGVETVQTDWGQVDLRFSHSQGSFKIVKNEDGSTGIRIKIDARGCIDSNATEEDISTVQNLEKLEKKAEEYIRGDVEDAIKQAKALSADVFGFGEAIRRDYPKDWEKMKGNWDKEFLMLEPEIEITVSLTCTGGIGKPIVPGGAE